VEGQAPANPTQLPVVSWLRTGRRYFDVIGARLLAGRGFGDDDWRRADEHVIVNERFARMYLRDGAAVGSRIGLTDPAAGPSADGLRWATVIGVVSNVMQRVEPGGAFSPVIYSPSPAEPPQMMQVLVRQPSRPAAAVAAVRAHVQALDPDLPLFGAGSVDEVLARDRWPQRLFGGMFAIFAGIAVCLAACGLYAVTAYAVSRRTREMGVRVALGADGRRIWWAVTGPTLRQLLIGIVIGVAGAAAVAAVLPAMLVGTSTGGANALAIAGVALLLLAVGLGAGTVPARRAMRVDPVTVLQAE
jgi:putative ABC transport system permease protein